MGASRYNIDSNGKVKAIEKECNARVLLRGRGSDAATGKPEQEPKHRSTLMQWLHYSLITVSLYTPKSKKSHVDISKLWISPMYSIRMKMFSIFVYFWCYMS